MNNKFSDFIPSKTSFGIKLYHSMKAYELELDINTDVNKTYEQAINKRKLNNKTK